MACAAETPAQRASTELDRYGVLLSVIGVGPAQRHLWRVRLCRRVCACVCVCLRGFFSLLLRLLLIVATASEEEEEELAGEFFYRYQVIDLEGHVY